MESLYQGEEDFLSEFGAREAAPKLSLEMQLAGCHDGALDQCSSPSCRPSSRSHLRVGFADRTELRLSFGDDQAPFDFCLPSSFFSTEMTPWSGCPRIAELKSSRFQVRPWHDGGLARSCEPPHCYGDSRIASIADHIIQCKITDNYYDNPARRFQQAHEEPDPDVIPDIGQAPRFAQDLHALAEQHHTFTDPEGDGVLRLRTWYIHHEHFLTNFHSRIIELDEDWRRWSDDIIGSWRSHLQPHASIFFHLVNPDPYRGYLRQEVYADIIITQGNDLPRRAGLLTVHYQGDQADPHTYAAASSLEMIVSGRRLVEAADASHWCSNARHKCSISHGWQHIPFDHNPIHQMNSGHSFAIIITSPQRTDGVNEAGRDDHQTPSQGVTQDQPDLDYEDHDIHYEDQHRSPSSSSRSQRLENEYGVHIYRLDQPDAHCYIEWSTYRRILFDITRCLLVRRNDIVGLHYVQAVPVGLNQDHERAVIVQSIYDMPAASRDHLILLDIEIHLHAQHDGLLVSPTTTRKVLRIHPPLHRSQILLLNGVHDYCELHGDKCIVLENNEIWSVHDRTLHDLPHGTYIRIQIPPPEDPLLDTETAIAISREFALETYRGPQTSCSARDHEPHSSSPRQEGDSSTFFQLPADRLDEACQISVQAAGKSTWRVAPEHVVSSPGLVSSGAHQQQPAAQRPHSSFHDRDFTSLSRLFELEAMTECEEEGPIAYVDTWYVHHAQHPRCRDPKAVKLFQDPSTWLEDIIEPWRDIIDQDADIVVFLVRPKPPCTPMECVMAHFIIEQASRPDMVVSLISSHIVDFREASIEHLALSIPSLVSEPMILRAAELHVECRFKFCSVQRGGIPFGMGDFDYVDPGCNLVIQIREHTLLFNDPDGESDASHLMQQPAGDHSPSHWEPEWSPIPESFTFNPGVQAYCPEQQPVDVRPENLQALHEHWLRTAFSWEDETASTSVVTWFVDQHNQALHTCSQARTVRLFQDFDTWERALRDACQDLQLPGAPILMHLVMPTPPNVGEETAAHIIIVQNPQDSLSSSLVSIYDSDGVRTELQQQVAVTAQEQLLLEHLIYGLGLERRCILPGANFLCEAWLRHQPLQLGHPEFVRDGTGIVLQLSRRATPLPTASSSSSSATNLLQIGTRILNRRERRLTHGLVAHTHGPPPKAQAIHLIPIGSNQGPFPSYIEVPDPVSMKAIVSELQCYGISDHITLLSNNLVALIGSPCDSSSQPTCHYVYSSKDEPWTVHLHSYPGESCTDLEHMRHLYKLGFEKAVILHRRNHAVGIVEIHFTVAKGEMQNQEKKIKTLPPWPPQQLRRKVDLMFTVEDYHESNTPCILNCNISRADLLAFFTSSKGTLCTSVEGLDLPDICRQRFASLASHNHFDRLVIYVDGSSQASSKHIAPQRNEEQSTPDAWCFLVLGETYTSPTTSDLSFIGWSAHQVRYGEDHDWSLGADRIGSAIAEREGLSWAFLWRIGQNSNIPTLFRSDSMLAIQQAKGEIGSLQCDSSFQTLRGCAQLLESALDENAFNLEHVPGHAGDPFNEFCDWGAKQEGRHGFFLRRPTLQLALWRPLLPYLWMLRGAAFGLPSFRGTGFDVHPPDLPPKTPPTTASPKPQRKKLFDFDMSIATGNVMTLGKGAQGFAGKLQYLRAQFCDFHLNFLGLQETRSEEGTSLQHGILRLSSGCAKNQGGVELWCNLRQPIALSCGKSIFLARQNFTVAHRDHRRLLVRVQHEFFDAWFLVAYAPHSGYSQSERAQWWQESQDIIWSAKDEQTPLFVCIDANAGLGGPIEENFFATEFRTSTSTPFLQDFLKSFQLCAPIASAVHEGTRCTWTSPMQEEFTIDYVFIPTLWKDRCFRSRVIEEFDMGNQLIDHSVLAVELQWRQTLHLGQSSKEGQSRFDRAQIQKNMPKEFRPFNVSPWHTNVETHLMELNSQFHSQLARSCPKPRGGPSRPYIDEEIWQLRRAKLRHRAQLKHLRHLIRRETLARVLLAWKQGSEWESSPSFNFGSTLQIGILKHGLGFRRCATALRAQIASNKAKILLQTVAEFDTHTAAGDIQQRLRPFMGPSNKWKQGLAPLPMIKDENGLLCKSQESVLNRWISFFSEMEGGQRMEITEQRELWRSNLEQLRSFIIDLHITEMPSLAELEHACRHVAAGKASGMDGIPSELLRFCPKDMAKQLYSLLLKVSIQGQEPLEHKGGFLIPIWKGKLNKDCCQAFRSILISSMVGKTLHKALRAKQTDLYQTYLHSQQLGGRKGISVVLGGHLVRAFLRVFAAQNKPTAVIFIDLQEAFYRVVRPLAISGPWTDDLVATMASRLNLNQHILQDLYAHLRAPSAVEQAQMSSTAQRAIQALHTDTFFALPGQHDRVRTLHGSRPGDSYADVVFGYLMSRVLRMFEAELEPLHILEKFPQEPEIDLHAHGFPSNDMAEQTMVGPCWMDDLAIPLSAASNDDLLTNLRTATSTILDLLRAHAMTPNLSPGKTEILFKPRGPGSQQCRKRLFGPQAPGTLEVIGEYNGYQINVVTSYVHLGGLTHYTGDLRAEIRRRIAIANQSFNKHRKLIYQNEGIHHDKRGEIFNSLILSRLLFGSETWFIRDQKTKDYLHCAIIRLYKRLLKCSSDAHMSDAEVLHLTGMPAPATLLRLRRLSYLGSLLTIGSLAHWGLINRDQAWLDLVKDDLQWLWDQLSNTCQLGNPFDHTARWIEVIRHHRGYWRRLLRRAREHSILVASRQWVCVGAYIRVRSLLQESGFLTTKQPTIPSAVQNDFFFGCMQCGMRCRSFAGEGAHMNKKHGICHPVRSLIQGTQCGACLKEYFTHGKLKAHLIRAEHCRQQLLGRRLCFTPAPGLGSQQDAEQLASWDGRLPPMQAAGPLADRVQPRDFEVEHVELFEQVALMIVDLTEDALPTFEAEVRRIVQAMPIAWTTCVRTLRSLQEAFLQAEMEHSADFTEQITACLVRLTDPTTWPLFPNSARVIDRHETVQQLEEEFRLMQLRERPQSIPKPCSRERIFLHVFSGRRREGDLQFFMEQIFEQTCLDGTVLCVVSLDLIIDQEWGNVRKTATQEFWLHGVRAGWVCGALCGPPCETWSQARFAPSHTGSERSPRPLRDWAELWGFSSLSLKEAHQVATGNELLIFAVLLIYTLACVDGFGVIEHPQEPDDASRPSIWRLELLRVLSRMRGVELIDMAQGLLGAPSPKPTRLLALNLPQLRQELRDHHITTDLPKRSAIGKAEDGTWKTSPLKEYPPAMNRALAMSFCQWFQEHPACTEAGIDTDFFQRCCTMSCSVFGTEIGPDYGG